MPRETDRDSVSQSTGSRPLTLLLAIAMQTFRDDPEGIRTLLDVIRDVPPDERMRFIAAANDTPAEELVDLDHFLKIYLALPRRKRHSTLRLVMFFNERTIEERGKVIKALAPGLTDREVAALVGVARETLGRRDGYKQTKRLLAERHARNSKFRGQAHRPIESTPIDDG